MRREGSFLLSQLSVWLIVFFLLVGCSSGRGSAPPTAPTIDEGGLASPDGLAAAAADHNRYLWSYHLIRVDPSTNEFEVIPVRQALAHWNVIQFLEQWPCANCFNITSISFNPDGTLDVNVSIKHPFSNPNLTGFDVRGIAMFNGSHLFPTSGLIMSDRTMGDGEIVNADGYTTLYNPTIVGHGFEGYMKGKLATATAPGATLNGYKRFVSEDPANIRNAFYAGDEVVATYRVYVPDPPNPWVFGYAIDACWAPPIDKPVDDPMTDFSVEANCPEAWRISVSDVPIGDGLTPSGGQVSVVIDVFDWQGKDDAHPPLVECPELFEGQVEAIWTEDGSGYARYEALVENVHLASADTYLCLVRKEAAENDPSKLWLDLAAHQLHELRVSQVITGGGWAKTWGGGDGGDDGDGVAVDQSGNIYVAGSFMSTVDFDPGGGVDNHISTGVIDVFLSKFDSSGTFLWARTWGGSGWDEGYGVDVDDTGNVYVTGYFNETVDFDPGSGTDNHTSGGWEDVFLSKFDPSGSFLWARTWGGSTLDEGYSVAADGSGNAYVTGCFNDTVDFDPASGIDNRSSHGGADIFLSKFGPSGGFLWARTWGGTYDQDSGFGVAADVSGDTYVTGVFLQDTVDFDPGAGVDNHASNGDHDVFLSKFGSSGDFVWARTWGGIYRDRGDSVAVVGSGTSYVAGTFFKDTVDFDPGSGVDYHTPKGDLGIFLSKFVPSGDFVWARTWGGGGQEGCYRAAVDGPGNAYVADSFVGTFDFDPGSGKDSHATNGGYDLFLTKFDSSGDFLWANTWGGISDFEAPYGVAADDSGIAYVTGWFSDMVDFDPGAGVDNHASNGWQDAFLSKFLPDGSW